VKRAWVASRAWIRRAKAVQASAGTAEVVTGSGEHGVDPVAVASFEVIAAQPLLGLDVPNDRLDRGAARISRRIGAVTRVGR
jgi:hypothetical protein